MGESNKDKKLNKIGNRTGMSEGSQKTAKKYAIKPGEIKNPKGRPPGTKSFKNLIAEILDHFSNPREYQEDDEDLLAFLEGQLNRPVTRREVMVWKQIYKAIRGDTYAFNAIADREEGKPKQVVEATVDTYEDYLARLSEGDK